ncbi:NCAM1 protein, partial [Polypterus senegalus]|nr:NCAM1 protein [Polypterus senegalus]
MFFTDTAKKMIIIPPPSTEIDTDTTIYCRVSGGEAEFQWFKPNGEEISDNDDDLRVETVDEETSKLIIAKIQLKHNGVYKCKSIFEDNQEKVSSISISVTKKISISNTDTYKEFLEGSNAVLSCNATGIPAPDIIWLHDRLDVTKKNDDRIKVIDNRYLHINGIRKTDSGTYTCKAQIKQRNEELSRDFSVVVNDAAKKMIIIPPPSTEIDTDTTIYCRVSGGEAEFQWFKPNGEEISDNDDDLRVETVDEETSKLIIAKIQLKHNGVYKCKSIFEDNQEKVSSISISVTKKISISNTDTYKEFLEGSNAVLSCNATGIPAPDIIWLHDRLDVTKKNDDRIKVIDNRYLHINGIRKTDSGTYTCKAQIKQRNEELSRDFSVVVNGQLPKPFFTLSCTIGPMP